MSAQASWHGVVIDILLREKASLASQLAEANSRFADEPSDTNETKHRDLQKTLKAIHEGLKYIGFTHQGTAHPQNSEPIIAFTPQNQQATPIVSSEVCKHAKRAHTSTPSVDAVDRPRNDGTSDLDSVPDSSESVEVLTRKKASASLPYEAPPQLFPNTKFKHIVTIDEKPFELVCYKCGTSSTNHRGYLDGFHGYQRHIVSAHKSEAGLSTREIMDRAMRSQMLRPVTQADIWRIKHDEEPLNISAPVPRRHRCDDSSSDNAQNPSGINLKSMSPPPLPRRYDKLDAKRYPNVIFLDDAWTEIWCSGCGSNVRSQRDNSDASFFQGMQGTAAHMIQACDRYKRDSRDPSFKEASRNCGKRVLSEEDVQLIKSGKEPKHPIVKYVRFGVTLASTLAANRLNDVRFAASASENTASSHGNVTASDSRYSTPISSVVNATDNDASASTYTNEHFFKRFHNAKADQRTVAPSSVFPPNPFGGLPSTIKSRSTGPSSVGTKRSGDDDLYEESNRALRRRSNGLPSYCQDEDDDEPLQLLRKSAFTSA